MGVKVSIDRQKIKVGKVPIELQPPPRGKTSSRLTSSKAKGFRSFKFIW